MTDTEIRTQIKNGGRLVIPAKFRKALKLKDGDELVMRLENETLRLIPLHQAILLAQENVHTLDIEKKLIR